ncbi:hypothetical protein [Shewanella ulleungensis]|uniref:Uncharacterized protein n=1 Tax=Shewanella ulleungensis TaxID=2282699 RepID=A0ABQ2QHX8_9GAMM|nr:hypothetical protein [Shewanella ulleungensis]MCL1149786.1 hypothetical protein [Shewanella ulleungensis]GGP81370.1 hypothetical protein GCM10009410_12900 [Shewanella ulleungensis]
MKKINFRKYKNVELLDALYKMNQQVFPERYQQLCDEIARRKQNGQLKVEKSSVDNINHVGFWDHRELIIEFTQTHKVFRIAFLVLYLLFNIIAITFIASKYWVTDISKVHQYTAVIDQATCHKDTVEDEESGRIDEYYDVVVSIYPDIFLAPNLPTATCNKIAATLTPGSQISIWHQDGLIHQLVLNQNTLLSYKYMKSKIRDFNSRGYLLYLFCLFLMPLVFFKSLYNAVYPGTFKKY